MPAVAAPVAAVALPRAIEDKFDELAHQIRRLRLFRGMSQLALGLFAGAVAAIALDAVLDLSNASRGLLLGGWVFLAGFAAWRLVLRPMRRPIPVADLAAAVEGKYPSLAERLYSVVDLSEHADAGNGSAALIAVLTRDTAQRAKRLNFFRAAPTGAVLRLALLTAVVALSALAPVFFVSGAAERVRRFLLPWYAPRVDVPFAVRVSSGDPVVKRGEAVTLTGFLERLKPEAVLPETAAVVYREPGADAEKKLPMAGDDKAAFHVTRPAVTADFEYCVEAGPARSEWKTVTVVDPVELADGTSFTITPPAYAAPTFTEQTQPGVREFDGLQYSKVRFDLKFSRPATNAVLDWKPGDPNGPVAAEARPVILSGDKTTGRVDFTLKGDGTLKLTLVGERNVRTELTVATKAVVDAPPKFVKVAGVAAGPQDIRPADKLPLDLAVEDDVKLEKLVLEYTVNGRDQAVFTVPLALPGVGTPRAEGKFLFNPAERAKEGDTVRYRIRAADGRNVPDERLTPQEIFYPEKGWAELRLDAAAKPLAEQEIQGQKEKLADRLKAAAKDVAAALTDVAKVQKDAAGKPALGVENTVKLEEARNRAKDAARELDDLAREAALTPDLRKFAGDVRDVAETDLRAADEAMRKAGNEAAPEPRDNALADAAGKLDAAGDRIQKLLDANDQLARDRLDKKRLEELAAEQEKLAAEAKEKANDPKALKDIAAKQKKLNDELRDLVGGNDRLKKAIDDLAKEDARDLADRAAKLAADQRRLAQAEKDAAAAKRKEAADAAVKKQADVAKKEADLARKTEGQAKIADAAPADPKQFEKAGEEFGKDNPVGALTEQEKAAREMDRLADALEKAAAARKDPKEAAKQLAKLEDEIRRKAADAAKDKPLAPLPADAQRQLKAEQEALRRAVDKVQPPPGDEPAKKPKQEALDKIEKAKDALGADATTADGAIGEAAAALRRFADKLPSREQRLKAAKAELDKLQKEQDDLAREIEEKTKGAEKQAPTEAARKQLAEKLAGAAKKQAELAEKLAGLDTPGLDARKERAADAARRAAEDLKEGLPQDVPASQADARRESDRLEQALDGQTPADEAADQLAKKQKKLADTAEKTGGKPSKAEQQAMQELQREINRGLETIKDPAAAQRLNRAKDAARAAEDAMRGPPDADELKKKTKAAAEELDRLADDLAGAESDAARADRLAREQQKRADEAKKNANKQTTPEQAAAEQRELERAAEELQRTRAGGAAQEAKKKAADTLQKLRQLPNPEKSPGTQKAAADAMKDLADQMGKSGDRNAAQKRPGDVPEKGDDDADGGLPSKDAAAEARKLAGEQRQARDEAAKGNEAAGKPTPPTDAGPVDKLAKEQEQLAKDAELAGLNPDGPAGKAGAEGAKEAKEAADQLKAGDPGKAAEAGKKAAEHFDQAAKEGAGTPAGKTAKDLAEKQKKLADKAGEAAKDAGAAAAQRKAEQEKLANEAGALADRMDQAAKPPAGDDGKVNRDAMKKAADAAREGQKEMEKAGREQKAGRKGDADAAREKAADAAEQAAGQAGEAAGAKPGDKRPDPNARESGQAIKQADGQQQAGKKGAEKGDGKAAGEAMGRAADSLKKAAESMGKGDGQGQGDGKGEGGGSGTGGATPGGNTGGKGDPTKGDLPADVAQYLGKPWGDLPGEVRTKIIQDLKAKYGEDYARIIKLYFEQLAERK